MAEVAQAWVSLVPSARGFGSKLTSEVGSEVDGVGKSMGSRFGKMFALAGAGLAAAGIGSFFKGAIEQASGLQEAGTKIQAIFGGGSNAVREFANQGAQALGQTKLEVLNAAANFGTFGKAAGLSGGKLAEFSTGFTSLATDLASFNNTTPQQAVEAIGSALRGEAEPMRQFGVLLDDATLRNEALKLGLIKTTKDALTPQQKVLAAQAAIYKQTGDAQGDFERTSGGLANQQRILAAQWTDMKARLGQSLLPAVTAFVTLLNSSVMPAIASTSSVLKGTFGPVIKAVGDAFSYLFNSPDLQQGASGFAEILDNLLGNTGALIGPLTAVGGVIQQLSHAVPAFVAGFRNGFSGDSGIVGFFNQAGAAAAQLKAAVVPILQQMAATFTGVVLPAVLALATYLGATLFPVFQQVAGIIAGEVLPIVQSFAMFLYGTLYPALIQIVTAVLSNLKPVFEQLVATFRGSVLPTIQQLLAKFREWQPTIQKVIGVMVQIIGKVLEFAAAILGKVLPPLIRFSGFLIASVIPVIGAVIGVLVKIISKAIEFGKVIVDKVKDVAQFANGVRDKMIEAVAHIVEFVQGVKEKFGDAIDFVKSVPGKIKDAIGDLGRLLYNAGVQVLSGLISGITDKIGDLKAKLGEVTKLIPEWKGPADKDAVLLRPAGQMIMKGLVDGIDDGTAALRDKLLGITDEIKSRIESIKSDMASLAGSVASAFTGNLFEATTASDFMSNLFDTTDTLQAVKRAFKKLVKWGLSPAFLGQLMQSGNTALILDLAASGKSDAQDAAHMFGYTTNLANQLGGAVAQNQYGKKLDRANDHLAEIRRRLKDLPKDIGKELNGTAAQAARSV